MGRETLADIITSIRNADMDKNGTVRIASTNIVSPKTLLKYSYNKVLLKTFGNIRKVTNISWFQPCAIEGLGKGYIELF